MLGEGLVTVERDVHGPDFGLVVAAIAAALDEAAARVAEAVTRASATVAPPPAAEPTSGAAAHQSRSGPSWIVNGESRTGATTQPVATPRRPPASWVMPHMPPTSSMSRRSPR